MKFYSYLIITIFSIFFYTNAFAVEGLTVDDCITGKYKDFYDSSTCDKCGYFNDGVYRLYKDTPTDYWDYFNNLDNTEKIFASNGSEASVVDFGNHLNNEELTGTGLWSSWVPADIPDNNAVIFFLDDLTFTNEAGASREEPIGMIEYFLRFVNLDDDGDYTLSADKYYTDGRSTRLSDGTYSMDLSRVQTDSPATSNVSFFLDTISTHKECYAILPAWCGDGVIDTAYGETCDPNDPTKARWGDLGCSNTCQPQNDTGGGGGGSRDYCGDGKVDRPNDYGVYEECDLGSSGDWGFCNRSCKISDLGGVGGSEGQLSVPGEGDIKFGPIDYVTVGDGMNPFEAYSSDIPYIANESSYSFYFDELCVSKHSGNSIAGTTNQCRPIGRILNPGDIVRYSDLSPYTNYPNFVGYPDGITGGAKVGENKLVTTVKHNDTVYTNAYFAADYRVRTAKPTIATTGGGTSFVNDTSNISNVNKVAKENENANKNFIGAGVSSGDISSYSKDVTESEKVDKVVQEGQDYNDSANRDTDYSGFVSGTTDDLNNFTSYNGITNAFVLKDTNFEVNSDLFSSKTGARTYIIENGNLIINENISYGENIAFVVKGGNIKIDSSVTSLDGIYISIPNGSIGGEFEGIGGKTFDILKVNGSVYGNVEKLVSKRTYIKENASGLVDVGTVVSFGSSVFREPAPLTTTFINEFIESTKIAQ